MTMRADGLNGVASEVAQELPNEPDALSSLIILGGAVIGWFVVLSAAGMLLFFLWSLARSRLAARAGSAPAERPGDD